MLKAQKQPKNEASPSKIKNKQIEKLNSKKRSNMSVLHRKRAPDERQAVDVRPDRIENLRNPSLNRHGAFVEKPPSLLSPTLRPHTSM